MWAVRNENRAEWLEGVTGGARYSASFESALKLNERRHATRTAVMLQRQSGERHKAIEV